MAGDGKKVLIVDDEPDVLTYVETVLEEDGYGFITAEDGEAGLSKAKAEGPDVIILDVQMPKKDGFQVFGELRRDAATKGIPVIMLTGVSGRTGIQFDKDTMGEYFGSEPDAYIEKPIDPDALRETVKRLCAGEASE